MIMKMSNRGYDLTCLENALIKARDNQGSIIIDLSAYEDLTRDSDVLNCWVRITCVLLTTEGKIIQRELENVTLDMSKGEVRESASTNGMLDKLQFVI